MLTERRDSLPSREADARRRSTQLQRLDQGMDAEVGALVGLAGRLVVVDSLGERIWRHVAGGLHFLRRYEFRLRSELVGQLRFANSSFLTIAGSAPITSRRGGRSDGTILSRPEAVHGRLDGRSRRICVRDWCGDRERWRRQLGERKIVSEERMDEPAGVGWDSVQQSG